MDYEIIKTIDQTDVCQIYKVKKSESFYCLKIQEFSTFSMNEIRILKDLDSDYVVKYIDSTYKNLQTQLFIEWLDGKTLFDLMTEDGFSPIDTKKYMRQLIKGLSYIHSKLVIHRDIKPLNLMIGPDGGLKIIDFNLSCYWHPDELKYDHCGSEYYASPEMMFNRPYVGPEVDIWSAGILLYLMTHHKFPYESDTIDGQRLEMHLCSDRIDPKIDPNLGDLLKGMLRIHDRITMDQINLNSWLNIK